MNDCKTHTAACHREDYPFVTVVMPVFNESRFIADTLRRLLEQDYPKDRFEVIVADGLSTDRTRLVVREMMRHHDNLHLEINPGRRSSSGRNVGFSKGRGDFFVIVDGHCYIPNQRLLKETVRLFRKTGADCLGRPQPLDPPEISDFQTTVSLARASRLGHGGSSLIYSQVEGYVSTISNGASYSRKVFETIGPVDESFDACEDVEYNLRLEKAGFASYSSPALTVKYYPRNNPADLFRQMVRYGAGRCRLWRKHPDSLSPGGLAPPSLVLAGLLSLPMLALSAMGIAPALVGLATAAPVLAYLLLIACQSAVIGARHGWRHVPGLLLIYPAIHVGLGWGFLCEFVLGRKNVVGKSASVARNASTRRYS